MKNEERGMKNLLPFIGIVFNSFNSLNSLNSPII